MNTMEQNYMNIATTIELFLQGKLSDQEEKELLEWVEQSAENTAFFRAEQQRLRGQIISRNDKIVNKQWDLLRMRISRNQNSQPARVRRIWISRGIAAAAVIVFAFLMYSVLEKSFPVQEIQSVASEIVMTHCGERNNFVLPDGTKVSLNAGSTLSFPSAFIGENRRVELSGEAFFEVTPDAAKPFIVHTHGLDIRVLGTAFNVEAFPEMTQINTTLVHGKVRLEKEENNHLVQVAELQPLERVEYNSEKKEFELSKVNNIEQYIAWKDGKLIFQKVSVRELANRLELWYNVSVEIEGDKLKTSHFTGTFTDEPIDRVLKLLSISYPMLSYSIEKLDNPQGANLPGYKIVLSSN